MKPTTSKRENLYDAESDYESSSSFDVVNPPTPSSSQDEPKLKTKDQQIAELQEQLQAKTAALDSEKCKVAFQEQEIGSLHENLSAWRRENANIVTIAKCRSENAERMLQKKEDEHKDFVRKLGEAHAAVAASLLNKVNATAVKLAEMTRQYNSMEMQATTGFNIRKSVEAELKQEKLLAARFKELLKRETDVVRSLRHDLVDAEMSLEDVETRMHDAERVVQNVSGRLGVVEREKAALVRRLETVNSISLEMGEILANQLVRGGSEAERREDDERGITVVVTELDEQENGVTVEVTELGEHDEGVVETRIEDEISVVRVLEYGPGSQGWNGY